jgi:pyruvate formate lyase activating enzyme
MKEALFYKKEPLSKVRCVLCPHRCQLGNGKTGICRVRTNKDGVLYAMSYGQVAAYGLDPVEKKPLFHFHPGSQLLTYATKGCTLHCTYCQNYRISQENPDNTVELLPEALAELAQKYGALGVAASYSEPVVFYEFTEDTAWAARDRGMKSVVVTNGFLLEEPLKHWLTSIDAMKVDLKGNEVFYREVTGGQIDPVLRTIRMAFEAKVHVEVSLPLVPSLNDYHEDLAAVFDRLAAISPDIPLHILAYSPAYKVSLDPTPKETLLKAYEVATERLKFVYLGNVSNMQDQQTTWCPSCKKALIKREGHQVLENRLETGRCPDCQAEIPGVFHA